MTVETAYKKRQKSELQNTTLETAYKGVRNQCYKT